jgi:hypothetical protein
MPTENHSNENPALEQRFDDSEMPRQMQTGGAGAGKDATAGSPNNPAGLDSNGGTTRAAAEEGFRESRVADLGSMSDTPASTASDDPEGLVSANASTGVNAGFDATGTSVGRVQSDGNLDTTAFAENPTGSPDLGLSGVGGPSDYTSGTGIGSPPGPVPEAVAGVVDELSGTELEGDEDFAGARVAGGETRGGPTRDAS